MLILPYFQNKALKNRLEINRKENIEGVLSFFPYVKVSYFAIL